MIFFLYFVVRLFFRRCGAAQRHSFYFLTWFHHEKEHGVGSRYMFSSQQVLRVLKRLPQFKYSTVNVSMSLVNSLHNNNNTPRQRGSRPSRHPARRRRSDGPCFLFLWSFSFIFRRILLRVQHSCAWRNRLDLFIYIKGCSEERSEKQSEAKSRESHSSHIAFSQGGVSLVDS